MYLRILEYHTFKRIDLRTIPHVHVAFYIQQIANVIKCTSNVSIKNMDAFHINIKIH